MTTVEVIEAGLSENGNRTDLTVGEEVRAIERLMSLDEGVTPAKLCKRIGRSQAGVRSRMAVTILPARWRTALDRGDLSLAGAEAAASAADLGPEHLDAVCERLTGGRSWQEPAKVVADYRTTLRRADAYERAIAKARKQYPVVFTGDDPMPDKAKRLGELFDSDGAVAHRDEPCHAMVIRAVGWGEGVETYGVCTDPRRHSPKRVGTTGGSDLATDRGPVRPSGGNHSHAKRKGRVARLAHASETFAKARGGFSQTDLTRMALLALIREAGHDVLVFAATILGHSDPRATDVDKLLAAADTHPALVKLAGAVAFGLAETHVYWAASGKQCREYLDLLTASGWEPDEWTAEQISRNAARDAFTADAADDDDDNDGADENDDFDDDEDE